LFANKPTLLVINKIDMMRLEDLPAESRALVDQVVTGDNVKVVQASCHTDEGVMDVRNAACDALLAHRVEAKLKGNKLNQVINRIHVAMPKPRDDIKREAFIPEAVLTRRRYDPEDPFRRKLEKDIEAEEGGAGVYNINMRSMVTFKFFLDSSHPLL
jgi:nucleolar GTP-binding protein